MATGKILAGMPKTSQLESDSLNLPTGIHAVCDASSVDAVPDFTNCRCCYVDTAGVVHYQYADPADGSLYEEYIMMNAGTFYPIRNVTKVFNSGTTAEVYNVSGVSKVGLKVRK